METLEITVLIGFAVLASYLMWIHYHLIHRDFANDVYFSINSGVIPVREGLIKLFNDIVEDINKRAEGIDARIAAQNTFLEEQRRLLNEQTNSIKTYIKTMDGFVEALQEENEDLKRKLVAKQAFLDRMSKKEGKR